MKKSVNDIGGENWGQFRSTRGKWRTGQTVSDYGALGGGRRLSVHEGRRAREDLGYDRKHAGTKRWQEGDPRHSGAEGAQTEQEVQDRIAALKSARTAVEIRGQPYQNNQNEEAVMNQRQHDMGGMDASLAEASAHEAEPWAKMITSLAAAMREHDVMRIDELRRA